MQVINAFNDRDRQGLRSFDAIISACLELASSFSAFRCFFVRRLGNCFAHALAHIFLFPTFLFLMGFPLRPIWPI